MFYIGHSANVINFKFRSITPLRLRGCAKQELISLKHSRYVFFWLKRGNKNDSLYGVKWCLSSWCRAPNCKKWKTLIFFIWLFSKTRAPKILKRHKIIIIAPFMMLYFKEPFIWQVTFQSPLYSYWPYLFLMLCKVTVYSLRSHLFAEKFISNSPNKKQFKHNWR